MARYQSFEDPDHRRDAPERIRLLREWLAAEGGDGLLIPRADRYLAEYIPSAAERLAWATGFTGSAGLCLLLPNRGALFLDGRYLTQGPAQTAGLDLEIVDATRTSPAEWIRDELKPGARILYDPWLHSAHQARSLERSGAVLAAVEVHPVDRLWKDRPAAPAGPVRAHPMELAGESSAEKRRRIGESLAKRAAAAFIPSAESTNWLFNLRGDDVPHTPIAQCSAILYADGEAVLFADRSRLTDGAREAVGEGVRLSPPSELSEALRSLAGKTTILDLAATPERIRALAVAEGVNVLGGEDPVATPKAIKNLAEIAGMQHAHMVDGAAFATFLARLDARGVEGLTEIEIADLLEERRIATGELTEISFDTISASGPNAALPHYRVTRESNRTVRSGEFLLIDSGGQYRTGTTDLTRTFAVGDVPEEMRVAYTLVLRGMAALATLRFPAYASGAALDAVAREPLWRWGSDFAHGTGHGVGACLGVHEGPIRIAPRSEAALRPLSPGMIVSDEPGLYVPGSFGVRIENLLLVRANEADGDPAGFLSFESLTLAPIDKRPIDMELLGGRAQRWLDDYHARVEREIGPLVDDATRRWLAKACAPLEDG